MPDEKPKSYSQDGEDLIIDSVLRNQPRGKLLDIGAWDPIEFSNSRLFIERGWEAVLIEPSPAPARHLAQEYDGSTRVEVVMAAVGLSPGMIKMRMTDDAVSTSDGKTADKWKTAGGYYGDLWVPVITLSYLFLRFGGPFNFVNIDAEGLSVELAIQLLQTESFPLCLCVEHDGRVTELMKAAQMRGYVMVHDNGTNAILEHR